jgi:bacterioferritin-associated ferredoxin
MYVCLCNGLTDRRVREAAAEGAIRPSEVYQACGCVAKCGICARTLRAIIDEVAFPLCTKEGLAAAAE